MTGEFEESNKIADVDTVMQEIKIAMLEEQERQERLWEALA